MGFNSTRPFSVPTGVNKAEKDMFIAFAKSVKKDLFKA